MAIVRDGIVRGIVGSISRPIVRGQSGPQIAANPLVNLAPSGIVVNGSNQVTNWTNSGTGGSAYSLVTDTVQAGFTKSTHNGTDVANTTGAAGAYMQPAVAQVITQVATCFYVLSPTVANKTAVSGFSAVSWRLLFNSSSIYNINQGASDLAAPGASTGNRVVTAIWDSTDTIEVSGVGSASGSTGIADFDYCTLFANNAGFSRWTGWIMQFLLYDRVLTAQEITDTQAALEALL